MEKKWKEIPRKVLDPYVMILDWSAVLKHAGPMIQWNQIPLQK